MKEWTQSKWMYILLSIFATSFLIFYPKMLLLLDEYSYFNRGLALSQLSAELTLPDLTGLETLRLTGNPYLLGTPLTIALFVSLFGNQGVFLMGLLSFVFTVILMIKVLEKLEYAVFGVMIFFTFPPLLMLTRTAMSGMPSLLLSAFFFYLLICKSKSRYQYFLMALVVGFATLFRETNILVFGFFGLSLFWQQKNWLGYLAGGFGIGLGLRLISSKLVYGDYLYMSGADPFLISNIIPNLSLYVTLGLLLLPLGLWQIFKYNGAHKWEIKGSVLLFFGLYLTYSYNPIEYSGFAKGLLFGGRFLVPLLPIFVIAAGYFIRSTKWLQYSFWKPVFIVAGLACIIISQYAGHQINSTHHKISERIYDKYLDQPIAIDHSGYTSINRYINPLLGLVPQQSDLNRFSDEKYVEEVMAKHSEVYIIESMRFENEEKKLRSDHFSKTLKDLGQKYQLQEIEKMTSIDGTTVRVTRLSR